MRALSLCLALALIFSGTQAWSSASQHSSCIESNDFYPSDSIKPPDVFYSKAMIQKPAPYFEATAVINDEFKQIKLSDYLGKYVVLLFYPMDFTFVCPTELIAFSDNINEFRKLNTEIIGVSVDSRYVHLAWINTPRSQGGLGSMNFPLVSDMTHSISRDYGVLLEQDGHALRGLFIIDKRGILRQITVNDLPVGRSVDETLRLIAAFQFNDQYGEACPAGWKPGSKSIKDNPKGSLEYFQSEHTSN